MSYILFPHHEWLFGVVSIFHFRFFHLCQNTNKRQATYKRVPANPTKEGYMEKLSNPKTPLSSQWNRRYFELTAQGYLYYSKRKNEKNVESIYLRGCPIALEEDRVIVIQSEERSYKLRAPSHDDAKDWVECMLVYTLKRPNMSTRKYSAPPSIGQLVNNWRPQKWCNQDGLGKLNHLDQ